MKLGILGGSFNPIHLGHLFLADMVISKFKLDRVIFIPAHRSPFKLTDTDIENMEGTDTDRLNMLASAITGDSRYTIDDCEIRRKGVSYTVDTLEDIITRFLPEGKPVLIIGDDLAADFPKWQNSEKILQIADIVIARRIDRSDPGAARLVYSFPHTLIDNDIMCVSSQVIRQRIKDERSGVSSAGWRSLVPSGVRAIIEDRQLYGAKAKAGNISSPQEQVIGNNIQEMIMRIETYARETLSLDRFLHSRNTALLARDMCRRFGLDPDAGYLAGIAHDLAKQIDNHLMIKLIKKTGYGISSLEKDKPNLLHGKAAAVLLTEKFCINNKDILEAVACHTSGAEDMGPLAKVIYIADKTEVSRNIDPSVRKMCAERSLDDILFAVLEKTIVKLQSRKLDLSEDTIRLLNKIKG